MILPYMPGGTAGEGALVGAGDPDDKVAAWCGMLCVDEASGRVHVNVSAGAGTDWLLLGMVDGEGNLGPATKKGPTDD